MHKYKFKTFFLSFVLLSAVVLMVIAGFSSWIIGEKKQITPIYNFEDLFEHTTFEATYSAREIGLSDVKDPSNNNAIIKIDESKFNIVYSKDGVAIEGKPINAGTYNVSVTSKDLLDETNNHRTANVNFTIKKATPKVNTSKQFKIDKTTTYITTSTNITDLSVSDPNGAIFHDESPSDSQILGTFELANASLTVGNNEYECLFTPTDTDNFNTLNFKININVFATVTFLNLGAQYGDIQYVDTLNNGKVEEPTKPSRGAYHFGGWITNEKKLWDFDQNIITGDINLDAKWQSTVKIELTDNTVTYDKQPHTVNSVIYINGEVPETIPSGISLSLATGTDADKYTIAAEHNIIGDGDYWLDEANSALSATLIINKRTPDIILPTTNTIYEGEEAIISGGSATGVDGENVEGSFAYTTGVNTSTLKYKVGNTSTCSHEVSITFTPTGDSAKNYSSKEISINVNMRAVAYNNNTGNNYGTLVDALTNASSGQYIYVYIGMNILLEETIEIASGVHLVLPFAGKTSIDNLTGTNIIDSPLYKISSTSDGTAYGNKLGDETESRVKLYRSIILNMRNGADILVNGYLHLGGVHDSYGNNGYYSEINLGANSSITCNSGGTFDCFGYVKENMEDYKNPSQSEYANIRDNSFDSERFIRIKSGATLNSYLAMYDVRSGGGVTTLIAANQCPFSTFDFQAFQTYLCIESGATFDAEALVTGPNKLKVNKALPIIRQSKTAESLFYLKNGEVTFENYMIDDSRYSSRSIDKAKTLFTLNGDTEIGYLYLKEGVGDTGIELDTRLFFLPISVRLDLMIINGYTLTTDKMLKFLLGSSLTISEGSKFEVNNKVTFYTEETAIPYDTSSNIFYNYSGESAKLVVNGKIIFNSNGSTNGAIGGIATHSSTTGNGLIDLSSITSDTQLSVESPEGTTGKSVIVPFQGKNGDLDENNNFILVNFLKGKTYKSSYDRDYIWIGEFVSQFNLEIIVIDGITNPVFDYTLTQGSDSAGTDASTLASNSKEAKTYTINSGYYINIVINRAHSFEIYDKNENLVSYTEWLLMDQNYKIYITPSEGLKVSFDYLKDPDSTNTNNDWMSGCGHVTFTVYESNSENGTYNEIGTCLFNGFVTVSKDSYFKFKWTTDNNTLYDKSVNKNGIITTDPSDYQPNPTTSWNPKTNNRESGVFKAGANYKFTMYWNYSGSCLVEGTLVMMADGSKKKVEDLRIGDMVKVFNHYTGKLDSSIVIVDTHNGESKIQTTVMNLNFENGISTKIVAEHGFFSADQNKYVYINESNYQSFINERFVFFNDQNEKVCSRLQSVTITNEYVRIFAPVTYKHLNLITDNLLSISGYLTGIFNYFDLDENMQVDQTKMQADIEKYGLYEYSEWSEYLTYEQFEAFNVKYIKVSVGKGLVTKQEIISYIKSYL